MQENLLWRFICMQFVITLSLHHDIWSCQTKNPVYLVKVSLSLSNWQSSVTCHNCLRYVFKKDGRGGEERGSELTNLLMNSMTTITFHHREAMGLCMLLNNVPYFPVLYSRFY